MLSFHICVPKIMITWCTVRGIWCVTHQQTNTQTDGQTDRQTEKVTYRVQDCKL